jgi:TP901 family phage tail tape measure protein
VARKIEVQIVGDSSKLEKAFRQASSSASGFGAGMARAGKIAAVGLGAGLAVVGLGLKSALSAAGEFESTLNSFQAVASATSAEMKQVSKRARELGRDITLPATSAKDAAEAMTELAKGGLSVKQSMKAAKGVLQLAAAAQIGNAEAATIAARALNAFGLSGNKAGMVADVLANAANASTGEITDFAMGLQQSSAVAKQWGLSINETTAALMEMSDAGIVGSDAGTSLKTMLQSLIPATEPAANAMERLGVNVFDAHGKFVGIEETIRQYSAGLKNMTQEQQAATLKTIFGSDAVRAANIILGKGALAFDSYVKKTEKSGAAAALAAAKMKGFKGSMEAIRSAVETLQIELGTLLLPALTRAAEGVSNFIAAFAAAKGFKAKLNVAWTGVREAGMSLAAKIGSAVTTAIDSVDWTATGNSIVAGLQTALEGATSLAGSLSQVLSDTVDRVNWMEFGKKLGPALLASVLTAVTLLFDPSFWIQNWELMAAVAMATMPGRVIKIGLFLGKLFMRFGRVAIDEMVVGFRAAFPAIDSVVTGLVTRIGATLRNLPGVVATQFRLVVRSIGTLVGDWIQIAANGALQLVAGVVRGLARLAPQVVIALRLAANAIRANVASWFTAATLLAQAVIRAVESVLARLVGTVSAKVGAAAVAVRGLVGAFFSAASAIGKAIADGIVSGIGGLASRLSESLRGKIQSAVDAVKGFFGISSPSKVTAEQIGKPLGEGIVYGLDGGLALLYPKARARIQAFEAKLKTQLQGARDRLGNAFAGLSDKLFRAFDAETSGHRTAAEIELDTIEARRQAEGLQKALEDAMASGDPAAIARAQEDIRIAALQVQAANERKAYEDQRATMRENLEKRLALLGEHFKKEGTTVQLGLAAITKLMTKFGITFEEAGEYIGKSFMFGLQKAVGATAAEAGGVRGAQTGGNARPQPPIVTQVVLDGKVIAEAVRDQNAIWSRANVVPA